MKIYLYLIGTLNIALLAALLFYPYRQDRTFFSIAHVHDFYKNRAKEPVDVLILGDSSIAYGLAPKAFDDVGLRALSLAVPSSTGFNAYLEFQRFSANSQTPRCVVYYNSYIEKNLQLGLLGKHAAAELFSETEIQNFAQPLASASESLQNADTSTSLVQKYLSARMFQYTVLDQFKLTNILLPFLPNTKLFDRELRKVIQQKGKIDSKDTRPIFDPERHSYLLNPFRANPTEDFYFTEFAKLVAENKSRLIFLGLPLFNPKADPEIQGYQEKHWQHIRSILEARRLGNFLSPDVLLEAEDYLDTNHLNERGSRKFSSAVAPMLNSLCGDLQ